MEGVTRAPVYNPMGLPTSVEASGGGATYLTTSFGDMDDSPVPVDVKNGPPVWIYYVTAGASILSLIFLLTKKR
jgi:hypothetical protein